MMNVTYNVKGVENTALALVPYVTTWGGEGVINAWEVVMDAGSPEREVLGEVHMNPSGTYYVFGGNDEVEIDQLPKEYLELAVMELYYATHGVPVGDGSGDAIAVIHTDEDTNSVVFEINQRMTAVRVPADTDDRYRSDNEVLGYVEYDDHGLHYGRDAETGAITHGYLSPYLAGHAIWNELGD
jgi:hypothetical protein